MTRRSLKVLAIAALLMAVQLRPAGAQNQQSGPFSDAFLGDPAMQMQFTALWNSAFDLCKAEGGQRPEDCLIKRSTNAAEHGQRVAKLSAA